MIVILSRLVLRPWMCLLRGWSCARECYYNSDSLQLCSISSSICINEFWQLTVVFYFIFCYMHLNIKNIILSERIFPMHLNIKNIIDFVFSTCWLCFSTCWLCFSTCWLCFSTCWLCFSTSWLCFSICLVCFSTS